MKQSIRQELSIADNFFKYPENVINILSRNQSLPQYTQEDKKLKNSILTLFESIIVSDSRISNIYYISNDENTVAYKNNKKAGNGISETDWFRSAVRKRTQTIWVSHKSDFTGTEVISCLKQVLDERDNAKGVVGLDIELFKLPQLVENARIGEEGYLMILDDNNKILAHPDSRYLEDFFDIDDRSNAKAFKIKSIQYNKIPWKIVAVVPVKEIMGRVITSVLWICSICIVCFAVAFSIYLKIRAREIVQLNQTLEIMVVERTKELDDKNRELISANESIKEHAKTIEELAISRERNRMARDVHDTLGQTLGLLITLLQVSIMSCRKDTEETEGNLNTAVKIAKEGLNEVRRSISGLVCERLKENNLFDALRNMIDDFRHSGINVELSVNKLDQSLDMAYSETIFRICQEALTNSVRHGKSTEANILIKFTESYIKLFIFDNGLGCKNMGNTEGFGLRGMKQRVDRLNGNISYGSDGERGFNIHVELPLANNNEGIKSYDKSCFS